MSLTAAGFLLVFMAALILAFTHGPKFGLFAYLWAFYLHPPERWWGDQIPDLRWSLIAAVATIIALTIRRGPAVPHVTDHRS
jgi:hypothetical protein